MVESIELVLDEHGDRAVRAEWASLAAAGVPSLAGHTGGSNRPHITLAVTEAGFAPIVGELALPPMPVRLGGFVVFPGRTFVLARLVVPSEELLALHGRLHRRLAALAPTAVPLPNSLPGDWTPHVTLARRRTAAEIARALELLDASPIDTVATGARLWNGATRTVTPIP